MQITTQNMQTRITTVVSCAPPGTPTIIQQLPQDGLAILNVQEQVATWES